MDSNTKSTNVTGTGIAVALAVLIVFGLLFFGRQIAGFITTQPTQTATIATTTMDTTDTQGAAGENTASAAAPATTDNSGIPANVTQLMTKDTVVGTGAEAKAGDTVTVQYVGSLTNGTIFDASKNHGTSGFSFALGAGQVIKGWDEGVAGMKVGGTRTLVIPASLGYGAQSVGSIPANSTLVFQVELINVQAAK
jgi:FKBP-type peptidyl-prolyl cis-trans isomerase FkpA